MGPGRQLKKKDGHLGQTGKGLQFHAKELGLNATGDRNEDSASQRKATPAAEKQCMVGVRMEVCSLWLH